MANNKKRISSKKKGKKQGSGGKKASKKNTNNNLTSTDMTTNSQATTTLCDHLEFIIYCVFEKEAPFGYVYSCGNYTNGGGAVGGNGNDMLKPEFLARDVPRHKAEAAGRMMNFLSDRTIKDEQRAGDDTLNVTIRLIKGKQKEQLLENHCFLNNNKQGPLFELIPFYPYDDPNDWGSKPSAPDGRTEFAKKIWKTLTDPKIRLSHSFIRFIDCNRQNSRADNLAWVSLEDALRHVDDWEVDWEFGLTPNQISYVRANTDYFICLASSEMRKAT